MILKLLGSIIGSFLGKLLSYVGFYKWGRERERSKALEREIERGRRDLEQASEAQRGEDAVRRLGHDDLDARLRKFQRPDN